MNYKLRKWWCETFHIWESRIANFENGSSVLLSQTCDDCKLIYITGDAVLLFQKTDKGLKILAEGIYSVKIR